LIDIAQLQKPGQHHRVLTAERETYHVGSVDNAYEAWNGQYTSFARERMSVRNVIILKCELIHARGN
jgi:hypothetical protein